MAQVVETLSASFFLANKKLVMVKKIDNFKIYKKACVGLTAGVLIVGILGGDCPKTRIMRFEKI